MLLGQMLVKEKIITPAQLEEAINSQVVFGGRLGTNLIELGYLDEKTLNAFLAKKHNVPAVDLNSLTRIDRALLSCVPGKLVKKYRVVPIAREGRRLRVLMADPGDIKAVDELSFATGLSIMPMAVPEVRLLLLLEKYYGIKRDLRYITLSRTDSEAFMRDMGREKPRAAGPSPHVTKTASHTPDKDAAVADQGDLMPEEEFHKMMRANPQAGPQDQPEEVVDLTEEAESPEIPAAALGGESEPPPPAVSEGEEDLSSDLLQFFALPDEYQKTLSLEEAVQGLESAMDRDDVARIVLHFCLAFFKRAALLVFKSDLVIGWDGMGKNFHQGLVKKVMIPLTEDSLFRSTFETQRIYRGALPRTPIHERFLTILGGARPKEVCLVPVVLKNRVVNAIYGDNGHEAAIGTSLEGVISLAGHIAPNFERMIVDRKRLFADEP